MVRATKSEKSQRLNAAFDLLGRGYNTADAVAASCRPPALGLRAACPQAYAPRALSSGLVFRAFVSPAIFDTCARGRFQKIPQCCFVCIEADPGILDIEDDGVELG